MADCCYDNYILNIICEFFLTLDKDFYFIGTSFSASNGGKD